MRRRTVLGIAVLAAVAAQIALFTVYARVERGRGTPGGSLRVERLERRPAPALALETAAGATSAAPLPGGRHALVHFWATWCPPCRDELPRLLRETRGLARDGRIAVVAIATDTSWTPVREFFGGEIPPEVLRDASGEAWRAYGVTGLPDTYLVGPDGTLRARMAGAQPWRTREVEALLAE